jgi:hypothetical protein
MPLPLVVCLSYLGASVRPSLFTHHTPFHQNTLDGNGCFGGGGGGVPRGRSSAIGTLLPLHFAPSPFFVVEVFLS